MMTGFHSAISALTCFSLIIFIATVSADNFCNFNVKVKQVLLNEGFHRNLTYGIIFSDEDDTDWLFEKCQVGVEQGLPAGLYVNSDELDDFRRIRRLQAMTKKRINVEKPREQSQAMNVYLIGQVNDNKVDLWLPVHARYAEAQPGGGKARNLIMPPKLFLRCPDQRLKKCGETVAPTSTFLCNGVYKDKCSVKEIQYTTLTDTLIWDVPIGNSDHFYAIAYGTSLSVMSASLYVIRVVHEAKMKLRNLLRNL